MNTSSLKLLPLSATQADAKRAQVSEWLNAALEKIDVKCASTHAHLILAGLACESNARRAISILATFDANQPLPMMSAVGLLGMSAKRFQALYFHLVKCGAIIPLPLHPEALEAFVEELATTHYQVLEEASSPVEMVLYLWRTYRGDALNPALGTLLREEITAASWG